MAGGLFAVSRRRDALDARTQVSEGQTGGAGGSFPRLFAPHSIKQGNSGEAREEVEEEGAAHSVLHSTEKFSGEGCSRHERPSAGPHPATLRTSRVIGQGNFSYPFTLHPLSF